MGKLIAIVGNTGAGKTTLARALQAQGGFSLGEERLGERLFQSLFAADLSRYALSNQVDFLLYRAEQEAALRRGPGIAVVDGGLELDFHLFTRFFCQRGLLSQPECALCDRFYTFIRSFLPPPDLLVALHAPLDTLALRYRQRARPLEIARLEDLALLQTILDAWLASPGLPPILPVEADHHDFCTPGQLAPLITAIQDQLS